jgi:HEAT repeat protein
MLWLVAWALSTTGCEVTPEKIAAWKETEHGPAKIRDAVKSSSASPEVRGQGLAALVELGMLAEAQEDLKTASDGDRQATLHAAVQPLVKMAQGDGGHADTTRKQRNAKDALFQFRDQAAPADQAEIDGALIAWVTADLAGRMTAGGKSSDQILRAIGPRAAPKLVEVIGAPGTTDASRGEAARLLGAIGDKASREQAGAKLVEAARREKQLQDSTLQQIGQVGGDHAVAYLAQLAEDGHQPAGLRAKALLALGQGTVDGASLPVALRLASDRHAPGEVRDAAFELSEKVGAASVQGLLKLLDDPDEKVRWRTVEAALKAGGAQAVSPVLEGISPARSYSQEDLKSYVVHDLTLVGQPALPPLRESLKSKSWVARLVAAMAIGQIGHADDAPRVESLAGDATKLKGWPGNATIGSQAKEIAVALRSRK